MNRRPTNTTAPPGVPGSASAHPYSYTGSSGLASAFATTSSAGSSTPISFQFGGNGLDLRPRAIMASSSDGDSKAQASKAILMPDTVSSGRLFPPGHPRFAASYGYNDAVNEISSTSGVSILDEFRAAEKSLKDCSQGSQSHTSIPLPSQANHRAIRLSSNSIMDEFRAAEISLKGKSQSAPLKEAITVSHGTRYVNHNLSSTPWLKATVRKLHAEEAVELRTLGAAKSLVQQPPAKALLSRNVDKTKAAQPRRQPQNISIAIQSNFKPPQKFGQRSIATRHKHWTPEEDEILRHAQKTEADDNPGKWGKAKWEKISNEYFAGLRNANQCKVRWTKYLKPGLVRGGWLPHEDEVILNLAPSKTWSELAKHLPGRRRNEIRERWENYLDPSLKRTAWTVEEDVILFKYQSRLGNRWKFMSEHLLPGRSASSIKNRYYSKSRSTRRRLEKEAVEGVTREAATEQDNANRHV